MYDMRVFLRPIFNLRAEAFYPIPESRQPKTDRADDNLSSYPTLLDSTFLNPFNTYYV